ncbi:MAG: hypothetical protein H6807_17590 [Planctomycetes bacterium]|nr:hypothetical protein [Planctomycetota bacterium]
MRSNLVLGAAIIALLIGAARAPAQVVVALNGNVSDLNYGPLQSGVVYKVTNTIHVPSGTTLTIQAGAILKFGPDADLLVEGNLVGPAAPYAHLTSLKDDALGGDTNGDGPSQGQPGDWGSLGLGAYASGQLSHFEISYAEVGISLGTAAVAPISGCLIRDCSGPGIMMPNDHLAHPVTGTTITACEKAITFCSIASLAAMSGNQASGCSVHDCIETTPNYRNPFSVTPVDLIIPKAAMIGGAYVFSSLNIRAGDSLTIEPGVVLKCALAPSYLTILGSLHGQGTAAEPIVLTDFADDDWAGDTNKDGPSVGVSGRWSGINLSTGSQVDLGYCHIRFAGNSVMGAIDHQGGQLDLAHCVIDHAVDVGLWLHGILDSPTIHDCRFDLNGYALRGARWVNLVNFRDNEAAGNLVLDAPLVEDPSFYGTVAISARAMMAGCIVTRTNPTMGAGKLLRLGPGLVIKMDGDRVLRSLGGVFELLGTGAEPIILTSLQDDRVAGDTNKDGPSIGSPGSWHHVRVDLESPGSRIEHVEIRQAGWGGVEAFICDDYETSIRAVTVREAPGDGMRLLKAVAPLDGLVAQDCAGIGIDLRNHVTARDLRFATVTGCGTGIAMSASYAGVVRSSIAWGNATNFSGATAANLATSDGDALLAGSNGNIHADPLFLDPTAGDLRLQIGSPCIDAGDFALGLQVAADHDESSRINDHDLDGVLGADMGAYEFSHFRLLASGRPGIGQTMWFTLDGPNGLGRLSVGLLDGNWYYPPFGIVLVGLPANYLHEDLIWEGYPYPITIPNDPAIVGAAFGVQAGAALLGDLTHGNIGNLHRLVVED